MQKYTNKRKVIYIFERRYYYNYDGEMFFINNLLKEGYDVEVWSLIWWTFDRNIKKPQNIDTSDRGFYIENKQQFDEQVKRIKAEQIETVFICYSYHAYTEVSAYIRKKIVNMGYKFCNLCEDPVFDSKFKDTSNNKAILIIKEELKYICYYFKQKMRGGHIRYIEHLYPLKYRSIYNIVCTDENYKFFPNKFEILSKRNVMVHSSDYSKMLSLKGKKKGKSYIVFVDQFLTGHSDYIIHGEDFPIKDKERYYNACKVFFDSLEKELQCEVIIAAHPKAEYRGTEFGNRVIKYNKTIELIKDAKLVLLMSSTVYGITCYYKKPMIILGSEQMKNSSMWLDLEGYSHFFGKKVLVMEELDKENDIQQYIIHADAKYTTLINRFTISKDGIQNKTMCNVILDLLKNIFEAGHIYG